MDGAVGASRQVLSVVSEQRVLSVGQQLNSPEGGRLDFLGVGKCGIWEFSECDATVAPSQVLPVAALQGNLVLDMLNSPNLSGRISLRLHSSNIGVGVSGSAIIGADGEIFSVVSHNGHWTCWNLRRSELGGRRLLVIIHVDGGDCD